MASKRSIEQEIRRLDIDPQDLGMTKKALVEMAHEMDDPFAWLATLMVPEDAEPPEENQPTESTTSTEVSEVSSPENDTVELKIRIPVIAGEVGGPSLRHVDARLTREEAHMLKRIRTALHRQHAMLPRGRHVESAGQTVRWLMQQVAAALEKKQ
jgi:hypothetical protein